VYIICTIVNIGGANVINLKIARIRKGLTQKELGELIGGALVDISRYETGKSKPPIDKLCKMADVLNVTTDFLLSRTND